MLFSLATYFFIPINKGWDKITICLFIFSLLYSANIYFSGNVASYANLICYLITPVAFYRLGKYLTNNTDENNLKTSILIFALIYSLPLYMMTMQGIASEGIVNVTRMLDSDSDKNMAATLYGLHASIGLGCVGVFFHYKSLKILDVICAACLVVGSLLTVIHLVNRTGLVILVAVLVVLFLYKGKEKFFQTLIIVCFTTIVISYIFSAGIVDIDIIDAYSAREETIGYESKTLGGRSEIWDIAISNLFTEIWGWEGGYAHNLWLDIARVSGIFALIPFLIATVIFWCKCIKLFARKYISCATAILLGLNISIILSSLVEPIIEGSLLYFSVTMLMWGITYSHLTRKKC